jgi:hypothetical protein
MASFAHPPKDGDGFPVVVCSRDEFCVAVMVYPSDSILVSLIQYAAPLQNTFVFSAPCSIFKPAKLFIQRT